MTLPLSEQYINALNVMNSTASILSTEHFSSQDLNIHKGLNLVYKAHFIQNTTSVVNNYNIAVIVKLIEESVKTIRIVNETISLSSGVSNQVKSVPTTSIVSTPKVLPKPVPTITTFTTILISKGLQVQIPTSSNTGVTIIGNPNDDTGSQIVYQDKNTNVSSTWSIGPLLNSSNFYYDFVFTTNVNGKTFVPLRIFQKENVFSVSSVFSAENDSVFSGNISIPTSSIVLGNESQAIVVDNTGINLVSTLTSSDFVIQLNKTGQLAVYNNSLSQPALTIDNVSNNINVNKSINLTGSISVESVAIHNVLGTQDYLMNINSADQFYLENTNNGVKAYFYQDGSVYLPNNCHINNSLYVSNEIYIQNDLPTISLVNTSVSPNKIWNIINNGNNLTFQYNGSNLFTFTSSGAVNINETVTTVASNFYAAMPFQGTGYKKVLLLFEGLSTNTAESYTYNFPTPFQYQPYVVSKNLSIILVALSTTSVSVQTQPSTSYNGIIIIEGL